MYCGGERSKPNQQLPPKSSSNIDSNKKKLKTVEQLHRLTFVQGSIHEEVHGCVEITKTLRNNNKLAYVFPNIEEQFTYQVVLARISTSFPAGETKQILQFLRHGASKTPSLSTRRRSQLVLSLHLLCDRTASRPDSASKLRSCLSARGTRYTLLLSGEKKTRRHERGTESRGKWSSNRFEEKKRFEKMWKFSPLCTRGTCCSCGSE